jgi:hypothetical protein
MAMGAGAATSGATAAAAAIANAIKASGTIVRLDPEDFLRIVNRSENPLIVTADKKFLSGGYKCLTSYRGLAFFTKSPEPLLLPGDAELIPAKSIWMPG